MPVRRALWVIVAVVLGCADDDDATSGARADPDGGAAADAAPPVDFGERAAECNALGSWQLAYARPVGGRPTFLHISPDGVELDVPQPSGCPAALAVDATWGPTRCALTVRTHHGRCARGEGSRARTLALDFTLSPPSGPAVLVDPQATLLDAIVTATRAVPGRRCDADPPGPSGGPAFPWSRPGVDLTHTDTEVIVTAVEAEAEHTVLVLSDGTDAPPQRVSLPLDHPRPPSVGDRAWLHHAAYDALDALILVEFVLRTQPDGPLIAAAYWGSSGFVPYAHELGIDATTAPACVPYWQGATLVTPQQVTYTFEAQTLTLGPGDTGLLDVPALGGTIQLRLDRAAEGDYGFVGDDGGGFAGSMLPAD